MQLVQFFAYTISGISVYGISRMVGGNRFQSFIATLIFLLLTESLMESTTTQNDMLIAALTGTIIYFMLLYERSNTLDEKYLLLIGLAIGFALGVKSSFFLVVPSIATIFVYLLYRKNSTKIKKIRDFGLISLFAALSSIILAIPSGYLENIKDYGHPIGPKYVRSIHSFEGKNFEYIAENGSKNILRFGFDFLSFDGFPPIGPFILAQKTMQAIPKKFLSILNISIEEAEGCRVPFRYKTKFRAHEDASSWGVFGFALIWPSIILSLLGFIKSNTIRVLAIGTVIYILIQSFVGPYDPWRGRYFLIVAIFAVPTLVGLFNIENRFFKGYVLSIILIGSISALSSVLFRSNSSIVNIQNYGIKSVFNMNRLEQLTRNKKCAYSVFNTYEKIVPQNARVYTILGENQFEYPLFGERFTRKILPLNSFYYGLKPIPLNADYLYFDSSIYQEVNTTTDVYLGCDTIYLRKLKKP